MSPLLKGILGIFSYDALLLELDHTEIKPEPTLPSASIWSLCYQLWKYRESSIANLMGEG